MLGGEGVGGNKVGAFLAETGLVRIQKVDCIQRPVAVLYGLECGEVYGLGAVIRRLNPIRQT